MSMRSRAKAASLIGALSAFLATGTAMAAPPPELGDRIHSRVEKMKEALSLTEDQATQVEAILKEAATQSEADRTAAAGDRQALRKLARERHKKTDEKIQALLTEDQKAKHAQIKEQRRGRLCERKKEYEG